jgi:hypothetical protein
MNIMHTMCGRVPLCVVDDESFQQLPLGSATIAVVVSVGHTLLPNTG